MIQYSVFMPEIWMTATAALILVWDLFLKKDSDRTILSWVAALGLIGALLSLPCEWNFFCPGNCSMGAYPHEAFNGFLKLDALAVFFKTIILLATLLTLLITHRHFKSYSTPYPAEFLAILLFSAAGASALSSAQEIVTLYIALETLTISSYLLASFMKKDKGSNEAGMKYLLIGAFSSALLLFGFSYLYGLSGTTTLAGMARALADQPVSPLGVLAVIMVIGGLSFKISLAPFHMWTPDVYEGAPTPVTAFLSTVSKTAGFAAFIRLFWVGLAVPSLQPIWVVLFAVLAAASIVLGNLEAIPQTNLKRLMAYSSIAQAGYISTGFLAGGQLGLTAVLFYLFVYLFANLGIFLSISLVSAKTGSEDIAAFGGMWKRSPLIGVMLLVGLLSLAGVPPFAGFSGKWVLFSAAVHQGYTWLAMVGMIFSVVSLYYYLMVAKKALVDPPAETTPIPINLLEKSALFLCIALTVVLGFWPTPIMKMAETAATNLF
jgi:NADH-quinone oxidoreductase subunit N